MHRRRTGQRRILVVLGVTLTATFCGQLALTLPASSEPESPFCSLPPDPAIPWLPTTPIPHESSAPSPRPASDCQFYRAAWQRFLVATQPTGGNPSIPTFLTYPSFPQIFSNPNNPSLVQQIEDFRTGRGFVLQLFARNIQRPNNPSKTEQQLLDTVQAGIDGKVGGYLLDQKGRFVFYQIHINPAFLQFIRNQQLTTKEAIQHPDSKLTLLGSDDDIAAGADTNIVEYKSAWMIIDDKQAFPNYVVVPALVPHFIVKEGQLSQEMIDGVPKFDEVNVAMLALHVVFTLPGHPEMIWSTFEHVNANKIDEIKRDNAPAADDNPDFLTTPDTAEVSPNSYPLYKAHTPRNDANVSKDLVTIIPFWDENTQSFSKGGTIQQTSVYRPFPGSKTNGPKGSDADVRSEDDAVIQINNHATTMFKEAIANGVIPPIDFRQHYRLVGAVWLNKPSEAFTEGKAFKIDEDSTTDDQNQKLAGEGRLGSTAMESFTESDQGEPQCFSCHDTQRVKCPDGKVALSAHRMNVSHVFSKYVCEQLTNGN
jgi:hypothetical protein